MQTTKLRKPVALLLVALAALALSAPVLAKPGNDGRIRSGSVIIAD